MLEIRNLTKTYNGPQGIVRALEDVSLTVAAGEFVAVQGPSGCGKSTLLLAAGGLLVPDDGWVSVDGQDFYAMSFDRRARLRAAAIGFVFQQFHLVPYLSVLENVLAPSLAMPSPNALERAAELIARFNLADRIRHVPALLSTGERQRVGLARALMNRPRLLLADEPTGNLDGENAEVVFRVFSEFVRAGGALLLVTHDSRAAEHAHRTIHLHNGRVTRVQELAGSAS